MRVIALDEVFRRAELPALRSEQKKLGGKRKCVNDEHFFQIRAVGKKKKKGACNACEGNNKHSRLTNNKLQEESHSSSMVSRAEVMPPPADRQTAASTCAG